MEHICSSQNNKIKYLKRLYNTGFRKKEGKFVLEGSRIIEEALRAGAQLEVVYMTPQFIQTEEGKKINSLLANDLILLVEEGLLTELADTVHPQGIIAIVKEAEQSLNQLLIEARTILVLDRIQDPGNMGTLIRTAVAAGVDGIIALKGSVDIYNLKVLRATMGAIFSIPVITNIALQCFKELISAYRGKFKLICTDLSSTTYYYEPDYQSPLLLVIGNEANGIRRELLNLADLKIKIPLDGRIESLNAAVAGSVIMYEIYKKRTVDLQGKGGKV